MGRGAGAGGWLWALVLVASIHLLTTPGTWFVTDQAEYLFAANRLVTRRTLDLSEPGETRVGSLPWLEGRPGQPIRSRLLPGTAVALVPLVLLDRLLGCADPLGCGALVNLEGHVFVLSGLGLLGWAVRRSGGSTRAAAMAVALTGMAWPVWLVSGRGGPEPILVFLLSAFLLAGTVDGTSPGPSRREAVLLKCCVCGLLPWVHPTGSVLDLALVGAALLDALATWRQGASGREALRPAWHLAWASAAGILSVVWLWNHLYHGNWWAGGYGQFEPGKYLGALPPLVGLSIHARDLLLQAPVLALLVILGVRAAGRPWPQGFAAPALLTAGLLILFSTFYTPEPARRFAVVFPAWGLLAGRTWDRSGWDGFSAQGALAVAGLVGFQWFMTVEGRYYQGPGGLFYPNVLWVKLAIEGSPGWKSGGCAGLLLGTAVLASAKVGRLLGEPRSSC